MLTEELLTYLFDGNSNLLAQPMAAWLASSRQFTAFVDSNRDKIRKKLRSTHERESLLDLKLELESAYLLLQERTLSLIYEPQRGGKVRGPDFAVTYTTSTTFMLEVTRLHAGPQGLSAELQEQMPGSPGTGRPQTQTGERLADSICSKLGQMLTQRSNVLLVYVEYQPFTQNDLRTTMLHIQRRVEQNDTNFLQRHLFRDRAGFFHRYQWLNEVLVIGSEIQTAAEVISWVNPQAKLPLPGKVMTVLHRSLQSRQRILDDRKK